MALNRIITIQRREVTRDTYGAPIESWIELAQVWAEKLRVKPSERFIKRAARRLNTSQTRFKIRQRGDVDETMRILDDNAALWNILGLIKNDRRFLTLQVRHAV